VVYPQDVTIPVKSMTQIENDQKNLIGLTRSSLSQTLLGLGVPERKLKMRIDQLWNWIYVRGCRDFWAMSNLAKDFRELLNANSVLGIPECRIRKISMDGTRKYLFRGDGGHEFETVYIPEEGRGTLCVSSQVGCTLNCTFCHTGTQAWVRNLTVSEIVGQIMAVRDDLNEWPMAGRTSTSEQRQISNVVLMGMGEPLYNFDNVRDAMKIVMDGDGLSISRRRITLSTAGVVPGIKRAGEEIGCRLAISFHATTDEIRDRIVPINRKWNITTLLAALRNYPRLNNSDRITFEYVMLKDLNDSEEDAHRLVSLIRNIPAKVNLIPFNSWPGSQFERSTPEKISNFARIIYNSGYPSPIRTPRGEDILAACGQLKSETLRMRRKRISVN